ncbi:radical SAM protein [Desulfovibrio legallii]|uniref:radical SAM protein n=1 Tax=Desulfovibrio legallii TaxID=571438 RepID=UPI000B861B1F|nr:radical SAM protein [Desulfovibrio legallii]
MNKPLAPGARPSPPAPAAPPAWRRVLPWPGRGPRPEAPVFPLFLPFQGCPVRCVFCAQDVQTGHCPSSDPLAEARAVLHTAETALAARAARGLPPVELAFYGGTFTALPQAAYQACLHWVGAVMARGWATAFRCSTRPDRVDAAGLAALRAAGCRSVELGVQSFADAALAMARRGYTGRQALAACALVREAGLGLTVQLLPGMPGHSPADFAADVAQSLAAGAAALRFYPCLVLRGTALAAMWQAGLYRPWPLEVTLEALAAAWLRARRAGASVIRMGLAQEQGLEAAVLDGPRHPALGARVQARALFLAVERALRDAGCGGEVFALEAPKACQGCFWGHKGELRPAWDALGLRSLRFAPREGLLLEGLP